MKPGRIVALVLGVILALPSVGLLFLGGGLLAVHATQRDDAGFFEADLERVASGTVAVTSEDVDLGSDPGPPEQLLDAVDAEIRLRAASLGGEPVFVGIGPAADVDAYLAGAARDEVRDVDGRRLRYREVPGGFEVAAPTDQAFWAASASGSGTQEIVWEVESGAWAAVLMNADGSPGILADLNVGIKAGIIPGLAVGLLVFGLLLGALAVGLIAFGARGHAAAEPLPAEEPPAVVEPVRVEAQLDPGLSPWQWLVKWLLAIPHYVVLAFLWVGFVVTTIVAFFAILFTGRYPRGLFDYGVGVLRWTWRVAYYALSGGLGTDQYPPFSLQAEPDYPATLDVAYPERLSRGLVLVKWWLLAIPHFVVLAIIEGGWGATPDGVSYPGLLPVLVLIAAFVLLFRGRYPRGLFDLIVGLNRWGFRVAAYVLLMTDRYPPFRLDQGGEEPVSEPR